MTKIMNNKFSIFYSHNEFTHGPYFYNWWSLCCITSAIYHILAEPYELPPTTPCYRKVTLDIADQVFPKNIGALKYKLFWSPGVKLVRPEDRVLGVANRKYELKDDQTQYENTLT